MLGGKTDVTNPASGPGTPYPCGLTGVVCKDTMPSTCCGAGMACAQDDGGPFCAADSSIDPADPATWRRTKRIPRTDPAQ